jgi:hypothetical protein
MIFVEPKSVTHAIVTRQASKHRGLLIKPGDPASRHEATSQRSPVAVQLLKLMPHMHLRGKSFRYEVRFPNGRRETLLEIPRYDFNWQTAYSLKTPLTLPVGARIHCVATFDNSEANLANPDPTATVRWGDQTWDEMMIGYFDVAVRRDRVGKQPPSERQLRMATKLVRRHDKNKDGKVERKELPAALVKIFDRLDLDDDGMLTVKELARSID